MDLNFFTRRLIPHGSDSRDEIQLHAWGFTGSTVEKMDTPWMTSYVQEITRKKTRG